METIYRHHQSSSRLELSLARLVMAHRPTDHGHALPIDLVQDVDLEFIHPIV
ncbi:MAG TPA: hypothetical protein VFJ50_02570 [Gemmatimonadales bacterium]|nr:hypothetical protein [Gemmatimonadales bacterium]